MRGLRRVGKRGLSYTSSSRRRRWSASAATTALLLLVCAGCGPAALTRDQAKKILLDEKMLQPTLSSTIDIGQFCEQVLTYVDIDEPELSELETTLDKQARPLLRAGLLQGHLDRVKTCGGKPTDDVFDGQYSEWTIEITDKGKQLGLKPGSARYANSELLDVTNLSQTQDMATADYTWRWVPTDLGKAVPGIVPTETQTGHARFQRSSGGWKFVR